MEGYITTERLGTDGFGYDPVFSPEDTGNTFAELGVEGEKFAFRTVLEPWHNFASFWQKSNNTNPADWV